MATLYEINADILACIDTETGEILNPDALDRLLMERKDKIRNIVCLIKNLLSDAKDYGEEENVFKKRKTVALNKADSLKKYLSNMIYGEKITAKEFSIGWRPSQQVIIDDGAVIPSAYLVPVEPKVDKLGLKECLKAGMTFPGIHLVNVNNIQIK